jgi:dihydroorotate dehydrogenase electron transfer subunit
MTPSQPLPTAASSCSHPTPFFQGTVPVLENVRLARDTYRIRLEAAQLGRAILPGQFVMLRLPKRTDPLLGRPFALYDTVLDSQGQVIGLDIVYLVIGKLTGLLAEAQQGDAVVVWGPLGNGFPDLSGRKHVGLVAGGIGQTPFLAHIRDLLGGRGYGGKTAAGKVEQVSVFYGVRSADLLAGVNDFRQAGAVVHVATDDGSAGYGGFVTALLDQQLASPTGPPIDHLVGCGPEPMLVALIKLAERRGLACHVSLESPMACGVGICFSCVAPVKTADGWDYARVCVEGPVFDARSLMVFEQGLRVP